MTDKSVRKDIHKAIARQQDPDDDMAEERKLSTFVAGGLGALFGGAMARGRAKGVVRRGEFDQMYKGDPNIAAGRKSFLRMQTAAGAMAGAGLGGMAGIAGAPASKTRKQKK